MYRYLLEMAIDHERFQLFKTSNSFIKPFFVIAIVLLNKKRSSIFLYAMHYNQTPS